jgi:alanine racemase
MSTLESFDLRQWAGYRAANAAPVSQVVIDSHHVCSSHALFVALPGRRLHGHDFVRQAAQNGARYAIVEEKWQPPSDLPASIQLLRVANPLTALQQLAMTYRKQQSAKVIAITGSQGKTMLKDMLQTYLSGTHRVVVSPESFNSQIGVALSLFQIRQRHEVALIEAGISQIGEMDTLSEIIAPDYAILTTIGDQHLAGLQTRAHTAEEKAKLLHAVGPNGWILIPDDPHLVVRHARAIYWNREDKALPRVQRLASTQAGVLPFRVAFPDSSITAQGELVFGFTYLLDLITIATKAACLLHVPPDVLAQRIVSYRPESTHTETWRSANGVTLINRPYCADAHSIALGLERLHETPAHSRKYFIFGGLRSETAHPKTLQQVGQRLRAQGLHSLLLYGDHPFTPLTEALQESSIHVQHFPSCQAALSALKPLTHPGDRILVQGPNKFPADQLIEVFDDSVSHNTCAINLSAVKHNVSTLRQQLHPATRVMVIVKALAYGTEDIRMARFLASCGVDILGVSYVDEGISLKRAGVEQAIFALNVAPYEVAKAVRWDIEVGVQEGAVIAALAEEAACQGKRVGVHLHVDTGMGRFGCRPEEALSLAQSICRLPSLRFEALMTHFSCADDPAQDAFTRTQIQTFSEVREGLQQAQVPPRYAHAANSAATLRFPEAQFQMVRIGLALYGLHASPATRSKADLKPALSLTSRVVGINAMRAGDSVGYNRRYQVQRPVERVAVLPMGYFDGLHRHLADKGQVMIRGRRAPIVGNICMDYLMVDITAIPDIQVGDPVLIFGQDDYGQVLAPEELAQAGNSIVHELIACLGPRIQRLFIEEV